jgi:hypothetical protein
MPSVTRIEFAAFRNCTNLTSVHIPNVTSIEQAAFSGCNNLYPYRRDIYCPTYVLGCNNLTSIIIPAGVTSIGLEAFALCSSLKDIHFDSARPPTINNPRRGAFYSVHPDARAIVPQSWGDHGVTEGAMWHGLFVVFSEEQNCDICDETPCVCRYVIASGSAGNNVTWVLWDDDVLDINGTGDMRDWGFAGASPHAPWINHQWSIKTVNISPNITRIGQSAFWQFKNLTNIDIPVSVISIGASAFSGCENLKIVNIPEDSQLTRIGERAFFQCENLTSINIPTNVNRIDMDAFNGCYSLISINIPSGVAIIRNDTFRHCMNLKNIYFESTEPPSVMSGAFHNIHPDARAIVPSSWSDHGVAEGTMWNGLKVVFSSFGTVPPTGVPDIATAAVAMLVFFVISAGMWGYIFLRRRVSRANG